MNAIQPRQPKGLPVGGQFAASARGEAGVALLDGAGDTDRVSAQQDPDTKNAAVTEPAPAPVYEFPRRVEQKAIDSIEKANRRAEKAGIAERFTYEIEHFEQHRRDPRNGDEIIEQRTRLTLNRPTVQHDGWKFAGTLTWDPEAGMVARVVPGEALLERPETRRCDVCGQDRDRRDTYVIQRDGVQMQVGSDCLTRFMGIRPAGLWLLDFEPEIPEDNDTSERGARERFEDQRRPSTWMLALGMAVVERHGWVSRGMARDQEVTATADLVFEVIDDRPRTDAQRRFFDEVRARAAELETESAEVLAAAREIEGDSDYAQNLRAVASADSVSMANAPLLLSAIAAKRRRDEQQAQEEVRKQQSAASDYIGQPKEKIADHQVTVTGIRQLDGDYGPSTIVEMVDEDGNVLKWFASGVKDFKIGAKHTVKGTIKRHEEYAGVKQTLLTRAKVEPVPEQ